MYKSLLKVQSYEKKVKIIFSFSLFPYLCANFYIV